jgi:hypothetical protein
MRRRADHPNATEVNITVAKNRKDKAARTAADAEFANEITENNAAAKTARNNANPNRR